MKYNSYDEYVIAAKEYFSGREMKVATDLMILPENLFNNFGGIIEFGPGSKDLVNKPACKCDCKEKCKDHKGNS